MSDKTKKTEASMKPKKTTGLAALEGEAKSAAVEAYRATEGQEDNPKDIDAWLTTADGKKAIPAKPKTDGGAA